MKRFARFALLVAALCVPASSCASFVTTLPKVIQAVDVTAQVIDAIADFADDLFKVRPDAELQEKVQIVIARTRTALEAGKNALEGTEKITQAQYLAAFNEFRLAYEQLVALLGPYGLKVDSGEQRARAAPGGGLVVPPATSLPIKA